MTSLILILISCNDLVVKKELVNKNISITWYRYSHISSASPDYVSMTKNDSTILIFESYYGLQDVEIKSDTILITQLEGEYDKKEFIGKRILGYFINVKYKNSNQLYLEYESNKTKKKK